MNLFSWIKKKGREIATPCRAKISQPILDYLKTFEDNPERFVIEYCYQREGNDIVIRIRDEDMGWSKGAWFYINSKEWYNPCTVGWVVVAPNLYTSLNKDEIDLIYQTVKKQYDVKNRNKALGVLEENLGGYGQ